MYQKELAKEIMKSVDLCEVLFISLCVSPFCYHLSFGITLFWLYLTFYLTCVYSTLHPLFLQFDIRLPFVCL